MTVIIHFYQGNIAFLKLGGPWGWLRICIRGPVVYKSRTCLLQMNNIDYLGFNNTFRPVIVKTNRIRPK